jgi:hypothetical protein
MEGFFLGQWNFNHFMIQELYQVYTYPDLSGNENVVVAPQGEYPAKQDLQLGLFLRNDNRIRKNRKN